MVSQEKWSDEKFYHMRKEVLASWPTGAEVDIEDGIAYHKQFMQERNCAKRLARARAEGDTLIQPRSGISPISSCIELFLYLQEEGLCDISSTSVDSYTRGNRYEAAGEAYKKSEADNHSYLNGLPVCNLGVKKLRTLVEALKNPMDLRTSSVDARLSAEIALAAGYSAFIHGQVCTTMHYNKGVSLEQATEWYQYVFRLMGKYCEAGIPICGDVFGTFSNVGVPQSFIFANVVVEALTAAAQGIKDIMVNVIMQGNVIQDIAGAQVLRGLVEEYLEKLGYGDVNIYVVANQWTGPYPPEFAAAYAIDAMNTFSAVVGGADTMMIKAVDQGLALPTKENNAAGLRFTRRMIDYLKRQKISFSSERLETEKYYIIKETKQLVDFMLNIGDGDLVAGCVKAYDDQIMESPFSSNKNYNHSKVMCARDKYGACRYLEFGDLPFTKDIKQFHSACLRERIDSEGYKDEEVRLISDSILALSRYTI